MWYLHDISNYIDNLEGLFLLSCRNEIEDMVALVAKESAAQKKLEQLIEEWRVEKLCFIDHGSRSNIYLKVW